MRSSWFIGRALGTLRQRGTFSISRKSCTRATKNSSHIYMERLILWLRSSVTIPMLITLSSHAMCMPGRSQSRGACLQKLFRIRETYSRLPRHRTLYANRSMTTRLWGKARLLLAKTLLPQVVYSTWTMTSTTVHPTRRIWTCKARLNSGRTKEHTSRVE